MPRRVIAFHFIWTCYGFWLPNDPRGSGSTRVRAVHLRPFGGATKCLVDGERSVAAHAHDVEVRRAAKASLKFPPVELDGRQALACASGIAVRLGRYDLKCFAAAFLPDHIHLVIERGEMPADVLLPRLKAGATQGLNTAGIHPCPGRKVWAGKGRHRFVSDERHLREVVRYVDDNPVKAGLPRQRWSFVAPM